MAGPSLVSKRVAAELARKAFLAASRLKKQAENALQRETSRAEIAAEKAAAKADELNVSKKKFSQLKRAATVARRKADDLHKKAEEAWQNYEDAKAAAPSPKAQTAKDKARGYPDIEKLRKVADEAQAVADEAELKACEAETNVAVADDEMEALTLENKDLAKEARVAERRKDDAQKEFDAANQEVTYKEDAVNTTKAEVLSLTVTAAKLEDEWKRVSSLRQSRRTPTYLKIRVPTKDIDADASEALSRISEGPIVQAQREHDLRALITRHGIASEVAAVTKELNRRRRSEVQNRVLAASYFETLQYMMEDHTGEVSRPKTTGEIVQEIKDTDGFVEAILIFQQETDNGPLKRFALELIKIVSQRKKIEIDSDFERNLLADQLRARL